MSSQIDNDDVNFRMMRELLRTMLRIRRFEEAVALGLKRGEIYGGVHLAIGQEAAIAGACLALQAQDVVTATHRSHGHLVARGADLAAIMSELMGRAGGLCGGKGGSMHLFAMDRNVLGASAIVGGSIPLAVGAALAARQQGRDAISGAFFGDGAVNTGACHESMNLAAVWNLPVLFLCENNQYALTTPAGKFVAGGSIADRARGYGMPGVRVDGQDAAAVFRVVSEAADRCRRESRPALVELSTYRFHEHSEFGRVDLGYRSAKEVADWKARDPIELLRGAMLRDGVPAAELDGIDAQVKEEIAAAAATARSSALADLASLYRDVFVDGYPRQDAAGDSLQCLN
jgi:pyruvate dehydrogenase E1 component alpha subunit